jgi:uncharacterized repeat protein (TIGR01451 family)
MKRKLCSSRAMGAMAVGAGAVMLVLGASVGASAGPDAAGAAVVAPRADGPSLVQETFTGATAPEFTAVGSACLTGAPTGSTPGPGDHPLGGCAPGAAGPVPPDDGAPDGYLRLTDASTDKAGAVLYNHALPASAGLDVTFDVWQYGSTTPATPADGVSFFLVNGDVSLTEPGAFGGSLGYAQKLPDDNPARPFADGVDGGYLGVGLDVLGNYFGDWEQRGNGCAHRSPAGTQFRVPAPGANMVTVRGPGQGIEGYCFLTATTSNLGTTGPWPSTLPGQLQGSLSQLPPGATPAEAAAALEPSRRQVNVKITPGPDPVLTVTLDFNDGTGPHEVLSVPAPQPVPATYKFGFAASTGLFTDIHLIRHVTIATERPLPELDLVKQVSEPLPGHLAEGSEVPYQFTVTNAGATPVTGLTVTDPVTGPVTCPVTTLNGGESTTCTAIYVVTAADVARGYITNTAVATAVADGQAVTSPPSTAHLDITQPPSLTVEKQVDTPGPYAAGDTIRYAYTVTNTGGHQLSDITVRDDHVTGITCASDTISPAGSAGDTTTCTGTYVITEADAADGEVTNHATASGTTDGQTTTSPPAEATLPISGPPRITVTKHVSSPGPYTAGQTVQYSYTVTNTGHRELHDVLVTDDFITNVTCGTTALAPGESTTCHGSYQITSADARAGHVTNRAQAVGTDNHGNTFISTPAKVTITISHACKWGKCLCGKRPWCKRPWHSPSATTR